jgi:beta-lactam-binding protein with PASTA domain
MFWIFRRFARWLNSFPSWLKLPVVVMEVIALTVLCAWLYVTHSVATVQVPRVVGMEIRKARKLLVEQGLPYSIIERNSTRTEKNRVIRQVPPPGNRIMETRAVELYVSQGPELVSVPDITGQTLYAARNDLYRRSGQKGEVVGSLLNLGNISRVYHPNVQEERIILQDPQRGLQVIRGSQVDVLVSKGPWPKRTVVPELRGKDVPKARKLLRENHLKVGDVRYILQQDQPPSVVLRQSPPSGRIVRRDRPVTLTVNLSASAKVAPIRYTFVQVTPPLSMTEGELKVKLIDRRGSRTVFNQTVKPGKEVKFLVSIRGDARLVIYWNGEIYRFRRLEYKR